MTRRNARTAGLITAAAVILLWSAWRIVDARLNLGTAVAAWSLWLLLAVALASAVAYVRELVQHRDSSRSVGWRPVPGVALVWIAGLATVAVFGFLMPDAGAASTGTQAAMVAGSSRATGSPTQSSPTSTPSPTTSNPTTSASPTNSASVSGSPAKAVPVAVQTAAVTPRPVSTTSAPRPTTSPTPTSTPSTTSTPLVTLPLLPNGKPRPTK